VTASESGRWSRRRLVAVCLTGAITSVVVLGVAFVTVWYRSWTVPSAAMEPTIHAGDHVWSRPADGVSRADIVILVPPGKTQTVVTRVVAVGGDSIESTNGHVVLNGAAVSETFLPAGMATPEFAPKTVPDGTVFVLGDNRVNSVGSQMFGPVPLGNVKAHVVRTNAPTSALLFVLAALSVIPLLIALFGGRVFGRARRDMIDARRALAGRDVAP
jgi:signal peptidase I